MPFLERYQLKKNQQWKIRTTTRNKNQGRVLECLPFTMRPYLFSFIFSVTGIYYPGINAHQVGKVNNRPASNKCHPPLNKNENTEVHKRGSLIIFKRLRLKLTI